MNETIEIVITNHVHYAAKWCFDSSGDRYRNDEYGASWKYRHAKFRFPPSIRSPKGKPKCLQFGGEDSDEMILAAISKKFQPFKFKLNSEQEVHGSVATMPNSSNEADNKNKTFNHGK